MLDAPPHADRIPEPFADTSPTMPHTLGLEVYGTRVLRRRLKTPAEIEREAAARRAYYGRYVGRLWDAEMVVFDPSRPKRVAP